MIIIQLAGGLGNQMQQYALYQKFLSLGKEAKLDISWFQEADRQKNVYAKRELELNYFQNMKYGRGKKGFRWEGRTCRKDKEKTVSRGG